MNDSRNIQITKFARGLVRDGVTDSERLISLRDIQNYDIDYENGALIHRPGTVRHHSTTLGNPPEQLYHYVDTAGNQNELAVVNGKLYWVDPLASHTEIKNWSSGSGVSLSFTSGIKYPFVTIEDGRCVFADDGDVYWTDNSIASAGKCYQLGIDKPDWDIATSRKLTATVELGYSPGAGNDQPLTDDAGTHHKLGQSFQISNAIEFDAITLGLTKTWVSGKAARVRVTIHEDDGGDPASDAVVSSYFKELEEIETGDNMFTWATDDRPVLSTGTTYWCVLDGDTGYDDNYNVTTDKIEWVYNNGNPYADGKAVYYDGTWKDYGTNADFSCSPGGWLDISANYKYVFTYYSNTYPGESQATSTVEPASIDTGVAHHNIRITDFDWTSDAQVTHMNIYRTEGDGTDYAYAGKIPKDTVTWDDSVADDNLGNEPDAADYQRPLDTDGTALIPRYMAVWKSRIWLVTDKDNILYYSLRVDKDGVLGYTGEPLYDAFSADCFEKIPIGDTIKGLMVIRDMLAVYMESNIWVAFGADEAYNPPADISLKLQVSGTGLIAPASLDSIDSPEQPEKHYFLSADGIMEFDGYDTTSISKNNERRLAVQSIVDGYTVAQRQAAYSVRNGMEYWLVLNDGSNDYIMIFDTVEDVWRSYKYYLNLNHVIVKTLGSNVGQILLAPTTGGFIHHVDTTVYSDRDTSNVEQDVDAYLETQRLRAMTTELPVAQRMPFAIRPCWHHLYVEPYHPSTAPTYTVTVTDKAGTATTPTLAITSDPRTRRCGFRVISDECRFKVQQSSQLKDEIRGLIASWTEM